jgi:hypothetical protein
MKVLLIGLAYFLISLSSYSVLAQSKLRQTFTDYNLKFIFYMRFAFTFQDTPALLKSFTKIICAAKTETIDCTGQSAPSNNQTVFVYKLEHGVQTQPPTQPGICNYR